MYSNSRTSPLPLGSAAFLLHVPMYVANNAECSINSMANLCIPASLLITSFLICCCSSEEVYYVTPSESLSTQCPDNPCHTLHYYVERGNYYFQFTYDCTFQFLPGNHTLEADEIILIRNVTNLEVETQALSSALGQRDCISCSQAK